jgi:proteasome lid subunit RPN8/RPN11
MKISIDGGGDIIIKRKPRDKKTKPASEQAQVTDPPGSRTRRVTLTFSKGILDQMEIRTEGVFRPRMQDVETAYGISGDEILDMFHKFTSSEVIRESTPSAIYTTTDNKIEYILEERSESPKMMVDVHTHPAGIAELSEEDRSTMKKIAQVFKEKMSGTKIIFGVHAVSEERDLGKRIKPEASGNRIKWRSLTREHEVAFYDENSRPVDVIIREP